MRCDQCLKQEQTSKVYYRRSVSAIMYDADTLYLDEDADTLYLDEGHEHPANRVTTYFKCSNGHTFTVTSTRSCPAVGCTYGWAPQQVPS